MESPAVYPLAPAGLNVLLNVLANGLFEVYFLKVLLYRDMEALLGDKFSVERPSVYPLAPGWLECSSECSAE